MALSIPSYGKKKPVTLQSQQQQVANPAALARQTAGAVATKRPVPAAAAPPSPAPPREAAPPAPTTTYSGGTPPPGTPNQVPTAPGANAPPVGVYDVPTPPPMPAPAPQATVYAGMEDVAGVMPGAGKDKPGGEAAPPGSYWEAVQPAEPAEVNTAGAPPSEDAFDVQVRQLMADLLAGKGMDVSTAEEEALIRELMQDKTGQALVEQRARMGRAGFGASGALAAMEGDIRRQTAQGATQETLALRRQAEQEAIDNALRAIGVDVEKRREGRQAAFDEEFLNALKSYLGQEETGAPAGSTDVFSSLFPEPENPLSTNNPAATKVEGNSVLDPVTKQPYEIRGSANPNDVKRRVLVDANGNSYAIYLDSEKSSPGTNVLYAVKV